MTDDLSRLTPANENPWYVLMTLYGEQEGDEVDDNLAEKNRRAWNAWSCQNLSREECERLCKSSRLDVPELYSAWPSRQEEIQSIHKKEMRRRNDPGFLYPGFPDADESIDISKVAFSKAVVLKDTIFAQLASFSATEFRRLAFFDFATFLKFSGFNLANFKESAFFGSTTFKQPVTFMNTTFSQDAFFQSTIFTESAYFNSIAFSRSVNFSSAEFSQDVSFVSAKFLSDAILLSTVFKQKTSFDSASFSRYILFNSAHFQGPAKFVDTQFGLAGDPSLCVMNLTDVVFEKPVTFRNATFQHHYPILDGTQLHDKVTFTASDKLWPDPNKMTRGERLPDVATSKESCSVIRNALSRQGFPEDEHVFFRREMQFAGQMGSRAQRLPYWIFGKASDYGHSISRPVLALIGLLVFFFLVYLFAFNWSELRGGVARAWYEPLVLSFTNTFKVFGFQGLFYKAGYFAALTPWVKFVSGVQTILGFVFLFFFGLGLRQRFRLR